MLQVSLQPFQMAGYLVTNAQYCCFVQSGAFGDAAWWPGEARRWWSEQDKEEQRQPWSLSQANAKGQGLAPVVTYLWQVQAYAQWEQAQREKGGRSLSQRLQLPTEAQWEGAPPVFLPLSIKTLPRLQGSLLGSALLFDRLRFVCAQRSNQFGQAAGLVR